jgi:acyl-phosphate glycerol 3-phosphate acyltransferase
VRFEALDQGLRTRRLPAFPQMIWILIVAISYLLGSIPSGYLVAKSEGIDIRQYGSKNIGATNVLRVMGKKWGYLVFFCDAGKGFLAVRLAILFAEIGGIDPSIAGVGAAIVCILGHNYTFWLGFKGGKGIATSGGGRAGTFSVVHCSDHGIGLGNRLLLKPVCLAGFDLCRGLSASQSCTDHALGWPKRFLGIDRILGVSCQFSSIETPNKHQSSIERYRIALRQKKIGVMSRRRFGCNQTVRLFWSERFLFLY